MVTTLRQSVISQKPKLCLQPTLGCYEALNGFTCADPEGDLVNFGTYTIRGGSVRFFR